MDWSSNPLRELIEAKFAEVHRRLDQQDRVASQIHAEVKATNGRMNRAEERLGVIETRIPSNLSERLSVVEQKIETPPAAPESQPGRGKRDLAMSGIGTGVAAFVWFLWEKFSK